MNPDCIRQADLTPVTDRDAQRLQALTAEILDRQNLPKPDWMKHDRNCSVWIDSALLIRATRDKSIRVFRLARQIYEVEAIVSRARTKGYTTKLTALKMAVALELDPMALIKGVRFGN